ncbi:MAG: diphosphate--fructose-6-phosphate 1-phosphotransferase [Simkania sp.]|nr:diphosphate--fructose-6-phosphate 1-phosphotransferase [Simkania sp.]
MSLLNKVRLQYKPALPLFLHNFRQLGFSPDSNNVFNTEAEEISRLFPRTFGQPLLHGHNSTLRNLRPLHVGVVFSGGQAAGGHNVIIGLHDALKTLHENSSLVGFIGGPNGIINGKTLPLTPELLLKYRNQGGFDLIGSGRTKIETPEQLKSALQVVETLKLDGLVIIGGDDSNTNAAILAEYFMQQGCLTKVIGVPKTIDGDLQNKHLQISFGFDTACKTYAEMIGNLAKDAISDKKYTHVVKVMGRSASHIALECAFRTHPNLTLIGEEIASKKMTLQAVVDEVVEVIETRAKNGKNYGLIIIPEGLIEFIPELQTLIKELNTILASSSGVPENEIIGQLSTNAKACYEVLPENIRKQLLVERDPHGNVHVSLIETDRLLIELVGKELKKRQVKCNMVGHFFGYEGRSGYPSNFDCNYCTTLGYTAALLIDEGMTGYMAVVQDLHRPVVEWKIAALPIAMLLGLEERSGKLKPVIRKALVDLEGHPFKVFKELRKHWAKEDDYQFPGPIQFFGDQALTDSIPMTMSLSVNPL